MKMIKLDKRSLLFILIIIFFNCETTEEKAKKKDSDKSKNLKKDQEISLKKIIINKLPYEMKFNNLGKIRVEIKDNNKTIYKNNFNKKIILDNLKIENNKNYDFYIYYNNTFKKIPLYIDLENDFRMIYPINKELITEVVSDFIFQLSDKSDKYSNFQLHLNTKNKEILDFNPKYKGSFKAENINIGAHDKNKIIEYYLTYKKNISNSLILFKSKKNNFIQNIYNEIVPLRIKDKEIVVLNSIKIEWTKNKNVKYNFVLAYNDSFNEKEIDKITKDNFINIELENNKDYYWQVFKILPNNKKVASNIFSFKTKLYDLNLIDVFKKDDIKKYKINNDLDVYFDENLKVSKYHINNELYGIIINNLFIRDEIIINKDINVILDKKTNLTILGLDFLHYGKQKGFNIINDKKIAIIEEYKNHPVIGLSWYGAVKFIEYLNMIAGYNSHYDDLFNILDNKGFRLLNEFEWEYLASNKGTNDYPWGNIFYKNVSNFKESGVPFVNTTPVDFYDGSYKNGYQTINNCNKLNICDLFSNIIEWINDDYQLNINFVNNINPIMINDHKDLKDLIFLKKSARGLAWNSMPYQNNIKRRSYYISTKMSYSTGFRVAFN